MVAYNDCLTPVVGPPRFDFSTAQGEKNARQFKIKKSWLDATKKLLCHLPRG